MYTTSRFCSVCQDGSDREENTKSGKGERMEECYKGYLMTLLQTRVLITLTSCVLINYAALYNAGMLGALSLRLAPVRVRAVRQLHVEYAKGTTRMRI